MAATAVQNAPDSPSSDPAWDALVKRAASYQTETEAMTKRLEGISARKEGVISQIEEERPPPPPPLSAPIPPPGAPKERSPFELFGGAATVLGALGGLLSRQPLTASLKAATGAMNAYHQRDLEAYQQNYQEWKRQSDYAQQYNEWQLAQYRAAEDKHKNNIDALSAQLSALASAEQDEHLKNAIASGNMGLAIDIINAKETALDHYRKNKLDADRTAASSEQDLRLYDQWKKENPAASTDQQIRKWREIRGRTSAAELRSLQQSSAASAIDRLKRGETVAYGGFDITAQDYQTFIATGGMSGLEGNAKNRVISELVKNAWLAQMAGEATGAEKPSAPGDSSGASLPPEARAKLKEGVVTTFGSGQKWTLKNGQPQRVQ